MNFDVQKIREQFPITNVILPADENCSPRKLIFFDHAASTHAPKPVLDAYVQMHSTEYANIHRGMHTLSQTSTMLYEEVESKVANFIGISDLENSGMEVVFSSNTTGALDIASHIFGNKSGDVLTTLIEHHSNTLPHRRRGNVIHAGILKDGTLNLDDFEEKLQNNPIKLVAITAGSNVTGYVPPLEKIARMTHDAGAKILVDGAQRMAHMKINLKSIDHPEHIDFFAGAGHKFYSPFGSSFLIGEKQEFDNAKPYIPAGGTVTYVSELQSYFLTGPDRHTPGTPNIAGAYAMGKSLEFLEGIGMENVREHEIILLKKMLKGLNDIEGVHILGNIPINEKLGVVTFHMDDIHHERLSRLLDQIGGIATRNGCFCAQPYVCKLLGFNDCENQVKSYLEKDAKGIDFKLPGAVRASIGIYNTESEVDTFLRVAEEISKNKNNRELKPVLMSKVCGIN